MTGTIPPVTIINPKSLDEFKELKESKISWKFLLTAAPKDDELEIYAKVLRRHGCTNLVRTYAPTYTSYPAEGLRAFFLRQGITLHDLEFEDGSVPPPKIINQWFQLLEQLSSNSASSASTTGTVTIAVHCVSGLSCAPVLIALALIDGNTSNTMDNLNAIALLRHCRRGCLNHKQTEFLANYRAQRLVKSMCIIL